MRIRHIAGAAALAAAAAFVAAPARALTVAGPLVVDIAAAPGDTVATVNYDGSMPFGSTSSTFSAGGVYGFAAAVPEADTWAMFIAGLLAVSWAVRRRRSAR